MMIQVVDGCELEHDLKLIKQTRGAPKDTWVRLQDVLEKIEKHTLGYLQDKSFAKKRR